MKTACNFVLKNKTEHQKFKSALGIGQHKRLCMEFNLLEALMPH